MRLYPREFDGDFGFGHGAPAAIAEGRATAESMQSDVESVPEKAVEGWTKRTFGSTVQWLRRRLFQSSEHPNKSVPIPE